MDILDLKSSKYAVIKEYVDDFRNNKNIEDYKAEYLKLSKELCEDNRKNVQSLGNRIQKQISDYEKEILRVKTMYEFDKSFGDYKYIAGVDEVGRGPLAGPIVSAAVILDEENLDDIILYINDSKKLSNKLRQQLSDKIKEKALSYSIAIMDNKEIDSKGIGFCNNEVFKIACSNLKIKPDLVLSDGYLIKNFDLPNKHVIKGDTKSAAIACASIIAKVYRDNLMIEYGKKFPNYGFDKNVGYGTKEHTDALKIYGITKIHRKSFLKNFF